MTETERLQKELHKIRVKLDTIEQKIESGLLIERIDAIIALEQLRETIAAKIHSNGHPALADEIKCISIQPLN